MKRVQTVENSGVNEEVEKNFGTNFPLIKILVLLSAFVILVAYKILELTFVKSDDPNYLTKYISMMTVFFASLLILAIYGRHIINKEMSFKRNIGYQFSEHEIPWNTQLFIKLSVIALVTGVLSALLGIGGGLLLAPALLDLGVHPEVVSATTTFVILFTSSSTTLQFSFLVSM